VYKHAAASLHTRSVDEVLGFFDGFELHEPGLTSVSRWRPDPDGPEPAQVGIHSGVAYKR
jgi:hypothetical protein